MAELEVLGKNGRIGTLGKNGKTKIKRKVLCYAADMERNKGETSTGKKEIKKEVHQEIPLLLNKIQDDDLSDIYLQNKSEELKRDQWRRVGRLLGLEDYELDEVECDYHKDGFHEICYQMLKTWQCKRGSKAKRKTLEDALEEIVKNEDQTGFPKIPKFRIMNGVILSNDAIIGKQDFARAFEQTKNRTVTRTMNSIQAHIVTKGMEQTDTSLKKNDSIYSVIVLHLQATMEEEYGSLQLPRVSWHHNKNMDLKELYVDSILNIVDLKGGAIIKPNIKIQEIFNPNDSNGGSPYRILIEADPGYGKTTFICKLVSDWGDKKDYMRKKFSLVFVILLRHFRGNFKENILDQFNLEEFGTSDILETILQNAKKTLLLLDGFDELDDTLKNQLLTTLKKKDFRDMHVIITSRTGEMFLEEMNRKNSLSSIGAKTKDSLILSFFNKCIKIEGIAENNRQEFLSKYLEIDMERLQTKISHLLYSNLNNFYQCPLFLFLLATIVEKENVENVTTIGELYKTLFNFLVRKNIENENTSDGPTKPVDVFDPKDSSSLIYRSALLDFSALAWKKMQENSISFTKEEILSNCQNGEEILHYGFLSKNTLYCRRELEFLYEPIHKTFLEFLVCFYLSNNESVLKDNKALFLPQSIMAGSPLHICFIIKLMGDRAHVLINILSQYAALYSLMYVQDIYSELEETEENERAYIPFIVHLWMVSSELFSGIPQAYLHFVKHQVAKQRSLLQLASENSLIHKYEWRLSSPSLFPQGFHVPILTIRTFYFSEKLDVQMKEKRLSCDELVCDCELFTANKKTWKEFVKFINYIKFRNLCFEKNFFTREIIPFFQNEFENGKWKSLKIKRLEFGLPELSTIDPELIGHMLCVITEFTCSNRIQELHVTIGYNIIDFNLFSLASLSEYLTTCCLSDDYEIYGTVPTDYSALFWKKKTWDLLYIDEKIEWKNYDYKIRSLSVEALKISHKRCKSLKVDSQIVSFCRNIAALSISTELLQTLQIALPSDWTGFTTIMEMELVVNCKIEKNYLKFLYQFHCLKLMTINFSFLHSSQELFLDSNDDMLKCFNPLDAFSEEFNIYGEKMPIPTKELNDLVAVLHYVSFQTLNLKILSDQFIPFVKYMLKQIYVPFPNVSENSNSKSLKTEAAKQIKKFKNLRIYRSKPNTRLLSIMNGVFSVTVRLAVQLLEQKQIQNFYFNHTLGDKNLFLFNLHSFANQFIYRKKAIGKSDGIFILHKGIYDNPIPEEMWISRISD